MRRRLVSARLFTLLRLARVSGDLAYSRQLDLSELHRRIVTFLGNRDGLSSADLVQLTGTDKAQVSRAVKALSADGLITRGGLRSKIDLSPEGHAAFGKIVGVARERDQAISHGLSKAELDRFAEITSHLTHRGALLLSLERQLCAGAGNGWREADEESLPSIVDELGEKRKRPLSRMVLPAVLTLVSYLRRSATVAYKRETGVSQFEWQILSQIAEHQPITLAELIVLTSRDKSHIGRTLKRLVEAGLVSQRRVPGKRETVLSPTAEGNRVYDAMCEIAVRRDDFLFAESPSGTKEAYVATIEKLTANAEAMLSDERERQERKG